MNQSTESKNRRRPVEFCDAAFGFVREGAQRSHQKKSNYAETDILRTTEILTQEGELAQLVERVLSMHEVAGSIPAFSKV
jgi:hypothetical protein